MASLAQMAHIKELIWDRNSKNSYKLIQRIYPFYAIVLFLYPLKIWGTPWLNDIFREYKKGAMTWNWLMNTTWSVQIRDFFWSLFSRVRTEYGDSKSPDSVRIPENTDQKKLQLWTLFMQWQCCYCWIWTNIDLINDIITFFPWNCCFFKKSDFLSIRTKIS